MRSREKIGGDRDRAQVLGVDRLRLPPPAGYLLGKRRPDRQQPGPQLGGHHGPFRPPDQVVVLDEAGMDGVLLTRPEADAMAAADLVDQDDDLTLGERPAHLPGLWARIRACQYACHSLPSRHSGCSCVRASPDEASMTWASSAASSGATAMLCIHSS